MDKQIAESSEDQVPSVLQKVINEMKMSRMESTADFHPIPKRNCSQSGIASLSYIHPYEQL
jgi:hypothetical protein